MLGIVDGLLGVQVKSCALGKSHVMVVTTKGRLYAFGLNNRGQCGGQDDKEDVVESECSRIMFLLQIAETGYTVGRFLLAMGLFVNF